MISYRKLTIIFMLFVSLFLSTSYAYEDTHIDDTINIQADDNTSHDLNINNNKLKQNKENKNIRVSSKPQSTSLKHDTNSTLRTYNNSTHLIMNAKIKSDIPVSSGYVIYKLNGITLKDSNTTNYKVDVVNSQATLNLSLDDYRGIYYNSQAVYSGSSVFNSSRANYNTTVNTRITPTINVTLNQSSYYGGDRVKLTITLNSSQTKTFNGIVIFKINGQTHKDANNNTLYVKMIGNTVNAMYQIPKGLKSNNITITTITEGNKYNKVQMDKIIKLNPLTPHFVVSNVSVDNNNYCTIMAKLNDQFNKSIIGKNTLRVVIDDKKLTVNNKSISYTITNGDVNLKVDLKDYSYTKHNLQLQLVSSAAYKSAKSANYTLMITPKYYTKVEIDTPKKTPANSNLSLRVYVTYNDTSKLRTINDGQIVVTINNQTLKANVRYGKAVINYKTPNKNATYTIIASYHGVGQLRDSQSTRTVTVTSNKISQADSSIKGNKDPSKDKIALINNTPNLAYMKNYVWADEDATYTLTDKQFDEVLRQDSYCLYLNHYLSRYVAFKTQNESNIYHVLRRQKWNVIEKYVNNYYVSKNTKTTPKNITVNLKGKSYTYSEVRDMQDEEFTCGPTASSVCTQALRRYVNEYTLAKDFKTYKYRGTYASKIPSAMNKYNITAKYYYKSSFNDALNQLSQGGCSLVFYGVNHYVSIIDISKDKSKVLVSNSYIRKNGGDGGDIPHGWVSVSLMKKRFSSDSFAGLVFKLKYNLTSTTKNSVNNLYNNFGTKWVRQNVNEII
ncbi:MAG: hypothetical protein BZ136_00765 [Methanosphaera sp. rholeuAM74]|nr:MAG: hypothetical protein BZ136_00765 [Methanosphaera sp. rholeuAM74]